MSSGNKAALHPGIQRGRKEGRKKESDRGAERKRRRRPHKGLAEQQLPRGSETSYTLILTSGPEKKEKLSKKRQRKQQKSQE